MPPIVATIAAVVASAVGAGTSIYEATQTPGSPKIPGTPPLTGAQNRAQQAEVSSALPNLQSLTGGSLSPEYAVQYGGGQTGLNNNPQSTGNIQAAINQFFGLSAPGDKGFTPSSVGSGGGTNFLDVIMQKILHGAPGGGTSGAIPPGAPADNFQGLSG